MDKRLPFPGRAVLWLLLDGDDREQAAGDFEEQYRWDRQTDGPGAARRRFWAMLFKSIPMFIVDKIYWRMGMIRNNLKMAWRIITRQKLYSMLNIAGLGISLVCLLMIMVHVKGELSYERGFPKSERIYRVQTDSRYGSTVRKWAASAPSIGPEIEKAFPEVEATARLFSLGPQILSFRPAEGVVRRFEEANGFAADPAFLKMFDLEFVKGNPETALGNPSAVVLTSSVAKKYFGDEDPIGKSLVSEPSGDLLQVSGIVRDIPGKTHLKIDLLLSVPMFVKWVDQGPQILDHRTWKCAYTYVMLRPGQGPEAIAVHAAPFMKNFHAAQPSRSESLLLQPIRRIHLYSKLEGELAPTGDVAYVFVFSGASLLILLIAVVNFVNLATAQAFKRIKEIGIRKVIGARKDQIVKQYLGEASLLTALSAGLALVLIRFAVPFYNHLTGAALSFSQLFVPMNVAGLVVLLVLLSLMAGLYPAFFVSSFRPAGVLKGARTPRSSTVFVRKGLVVFQFVISIVLIFSTVTMSRQLSFFHNKDLGFKKDNVIAINLSRDFSYSMDRGTNSLREEARRHSGVEGVALTSELLGTRFSNERLTPVGTPDKNLLPMLRFLRVDEDFIKIMGLTLAQGRDFVPGDGQKSAYIITESTAAALQMDKPLGIECLSDTHRGQAPIIGVIKDFNFASLHGPIEPLVLEYRPAAANHLLVKVREGRVPEVLSYLKEKAREINPDFLFDFSFVDEVFDRNYKTETESYDLFKVFSVVALFVACLGLFGLAVYAAESRVKEIGIRKTLGASVTGICTLLSGVFLRQVLAANAIALPLAYLIMKRWLRNFAYHTDISPGTFLFAGFLVIFFATITVGFQTLKAARENPVRSLRHE